MNVLNSSSNEFFNGLKIEIAILQEDVTLPSSMLEFKNEIGKFYVPVLFPLIDSADGAVDIALNAPKNNTNGALVGKQYYERNYINIIIPKYIVLNFTDVIPKGTKFLLSFMGEKFTLENLNIIGIFGNNI